MTTNQKLHRFYQDDSLSGGIDDLVQNCCYWEPLLPDDPAGVFLSRLDFDAKIFRASSWYFSGLNSKHLHLNNANFIMMDDKRLCCNRMFGPIEPVNRPSRG